MTFKNKILGGFGTALVILIVVAAVSVRSMVKNAEDRAWVTHTHIVLEQLDAVLSNLVDAETGQRGYIITGEVSYLEPYNNALSRILQDFQQLRELTADNPVQQHSLDQ